MSSVIWRLPFVNTSIVELNVVMRSRLEALTQVIKLTKTSEIIMGKNSRFIFRCITISKYIVT